MSKAKTTTKAKTKKLFIAVGPSNYRDYSVGVGDTKQKASNDFYDMDGDKVDKFIEVEVDLPETSVDKIPTLVAK